MDIDNASTSHPIIQHTFNDGNLNISIQFASGMEPLKSLNFAFAKSPSVPQTPNKPKSKSKRARSTTTPGVSPGASPDPQRRRHPTTPASTNGTPKKRIENAGNREDLIKNLPHANTLNRHSDGLYRICRNTLAPWEKKRPRKARRNLCVDRSPEVYVRSSPDGADLTKPPAILVRAVSPTMTQGLDIGRFNPKARTMISTDPAHLANVARIKGYSAVSSEERFLGISIEGSKDSGKATDPIEIVMRAGNPGGPDVPIASIEKQDEVPVPAKDSTKEFSSTLFEPPNKPAQPVPLPGAARTIPQQSSVPEKASHDRLCSDGFCDALKNGTPEFSSNWNSSALPRNGTHGTVSVHFDWDRSRSLFSWARSNFQSLYGYNAIHKVPMCRSTKLSFKDIDRSTILRIASNGRTDTLIEVALESEHQYPLQRRVAHNLIDEMVDCVRKARVDWQEQKSRAIQGPARSTRQPVDSSGLAMSAFSRNKCS